MGRMTRAAAQAWLQAETIANLGGPEEARKATPRDFHRAGQEALGVISRAARRALGERSDGRFHPLAATKSMIRTRNAR